MYSIRSSELYRRFKDDDDGEGKKTNNITHNTSLEILLADLVSLLFTQYIYSKQHGMLLNASVAVAAARSVLSNSLVS